MPWVQRVDQTSAVILWMISEDASTDSAGEVEYRLHGQEWLPAPAIDRTNRIRQAMLTGLPSATEIEYRVLTSADPVESRFRTAPAAGSSPVRLLLFGDSGWGGEEQVDLARRMQEVDWDLLVHLGDVAYEDGTETELTRRHFRVYADILATTPMFPAVGNHDLHSNEGAAYDDAFVWESPYAGERYYEFRWGSVQFVVLDTSSPLAGEELRSGTGRQYAWTERVLRSAHEDPTVAWTIVAMHHPVISHGLGISGHGGDRRLRAMLVPLFEKWGVDLVAAGHEHHYERSRPTRAGRRVPRGCGPVYLVAGAAGASRYARGVGSSSISAFSSRKHSFVDLSIKSGAMEGRVIRRDGGLLDEFQILAYPREDAAACSE